MKITEMTLEQLYALPDETITEIVYGGWQDDGGKGIAALLLGGNPTVLCERAEGAAQLYHAGRVPCIIPTGGVQWDTEFGRMSEAECMKQHLLNLGVPEENIILENEATTTRENMIFGVVQMERGLRPRGPFRVYVVSSAPHLRRSLALAKTYFPRIAQAIGYPGTCPTAARDKWHADEGMRKRVLREVEFLKKYADTGEIEDIAF